MFRSNPTIDRAIQFFALPSCYREVIRLGECKRSRWGIWRDLLELFFGYNTFPDNYGPCRFWEVEKTDWKYYYGSNYQSHQRTRLLRTVQPSKYRILFDDKAVCQRLCRDAGINTPHTYGIVTPKEDYREVLRSWVDYSTRNMLIVKPLCGGAGRGIVLVRRADAGILIQRRKELVPLQDFNLEESVIVQEVIQQDRRMSAFSSSSVNTLRVVTMSTKDESVILLGALLRSGVGDSYIDNWSAGGVAVGVVCNNGHLKKYAYDKLGEPYAEHPTSRVVFEGFVVPEWKSIVEVAVKTQKTFSFYRKMLGMDIALREDGEPVVIEVNGSPDLLLTEQTCGPLLHSEAILRAFGQYDLLVNCHQRRLYASLDGQ